MKKILATLLFCAAQLASAADVPFNTWASTNSGFLTTLRTRGFLEITNGTAKGTWTFTNTTHGTSVTIGTNGSVTAASVFDKANVKYWGAIGDGTDASAAFQAAIDHATNTLGGTVVIPPGRYALSNTVTMREGVTLRGGLNAFGHGTNGSVVVTSSANPAITNSPSISGGTYSSGLGIEGFTLIGSGSGIGISMHLFRGAVKNMWIKNFEDGIRVSGVIWSEFSRNYIQSCSGTAFLVASNTVPSTTIVLDQCYLSTANWAAKVESGSIGYITFQDTVFESCTNGIDVQKNVSAVFKTCYSEDIPIDDSTNAIIWVGVNGTGGGANDVSSVHVYGGTWGGKNGSAATGSRWIYANEAYNIYVSGAEVARVDKIITATTNTHRIGFWGMSPIEVGSSPYDIADWTRVLGTFPTNRSGGVSLPEVQTSKLKFQTGETNYWQIYGSYNNTNPDLTGIVNGTTVFQVNNIGYWGMLKTPSSSYVLDVGGAGRFASNLTAPIIYGGTSTTQTVTYQTTTGVGASGADHIFKVGNNGATEAMRIMNNGRLGIGTNGPGTVLHVLASASGNWAATIANNHATTGNGLVVLGGNGTTNKIMALRDYDGNEKVTVQGGGNVGIGTSSPSASALLDLTSTSKAFLPPRMTKTQRDAISSPGAGMVVFQTDNTPGLRTYDGTNWFRYTETAD